MNYQHWGRNAVIHFISPNTHFLPPPQKKTTVILQGVYYHPHFINEKPGEVPRVTQLVKYRTRV